MFFVIKEIVCIPTSTSSALRKNRSMRVLVHSLAPRTLFGSAISGRTGNRGVTVPLVLPMTVFTLGIYMCEGVGQDSGYGHDESHLMHDMKYSI